MVVDYQLFEVVGVKIQFVQCFMMLVGMVQVVYQLLDVVVLVVVVFQQMLVEVNVMVLFVVLSEFIVYKQQFFFWEGEQLVVVGVQVGEFLSGIVWYVVEN